MLRTRLLVLFFLCCTLFIPIIGYWYFFSENTSFIQISVTPEEEFHIDLQGSLHVKYLPLADTLLSYAYDCSSICNIGPIPPAEYRITISSTGSTPIFDVFMLPLGKTLKKEYILVHELGVTQVDIPKYSENIRDTLIQNLVQGKEVIVRFLGWRDQTHIYVEKKSQNGESLLGIMGTNGFIPLKSFSSSPQNIRLDETGEYFLVSYSSGETTILKRDLSTEFIIHSRTPIRSIAGFPNEWKIRTMDTVFEYDGEKLRENPRFTDYIDLDSRYRLGYIAPQDTEKLQLSNLPIGNGVLVLLDRTHGTSQIIARSVLINILSFFQGSPIYQDQEGKSWKIDISHFIQSGL